MLSAVKQGSGESRNNAATFVKSRGTFKSSPSNGLLSERRWKSPGKNGELESPFKAGRGIGSVESRESFGTAGKD